MPIWGDFKRKHVLDPTESPDFSSWNRLKWNNWLKDRAGADFDTSRRAINSIIISTPAAIEEDFRVPGEEYRSNRGEMNWSNNKYRIFLMNRLNNPDNPVTPYTVKDLGNQYFFVAKLEDRKPIHFHGQSTSKKSSGQINVKSSDIPNIP